MMRARLPLETSFFPQGPVWRQASDNIKAELARIFLPEGLEVAGPGIYVRHLRGKGICKRNLFATLVDADEVALALEAEFYANAANAAGVLTSRLVEPPQWHGSRAILVRQLLEGRHPPSADVDFVRFGAAIALLHAGLSTMPHGRLASATAQRLQHVGKLELRLDRWDIFAREELEAQIGDWDQLSSIARKTAVPCHGDLHAGNILVQTSGEPVILDFEEAPRSFLNPLADLARAFERLILVRVEDSKVAESEAYALFEGYRGAGDAIDTGPLADLLAFHRALSLRVSLAGGDPHQGAWQREVNKQLTLAKLATEHDALIRRVSERK